MQAGIKEGEKAGTKVYGHRSLVPYFVLCSYGTRTSTRNSSRARGSVRYPYDCRVVAAGRVQHHQVPCADYR